MIRKNAPVVPVDEVRRRLRYEPATGELFWLTTLGGRAAGEKAGARTPYGHIFVRMGRRSYMAHDLAYALTHGAWPAMSLDHIDGDPANNRIGNLRLATQAENLRNMARPRRNTSGTMGVAWHTRSGKWRAYIKHEGRQKHLGLFTEKEAAAAAWKAAASALGYHPNHGRAAE